MYLFSAKIRFSITWHFLTRDLFICAFLCSLCVGVKGYNNNNQASCRENDVSSYDFIIVGGGTSGCAVARRLSEKYSILLLHAGGYPPDTLDIPATALSTALTPEYTKVYKSVPQRNVGLRNNNPQVDFMIGRALGGGSSINGLFYNRGSPHDYDNWATVTKDSSWEYKNLLKYFKRMEDYNGSFPSDYNHGSGGPISISSSGDHAPGLEEWMEAGEYLGYSSWLDPNGPQVPGFAVYEHTKRRGRRVSSYTGYLLPVLKSQPNLKVITQAEVKRILFNKGNDRAVGVTYNKFCADGTNLVTFKAFATKEVIVSAGVMDSPAILMRSGIGPLDVLENSKIPVVKILPVGYNLRDHVTIALDVDIDEDSDVLTPEDLTPLSWALYKETGDGPYSSFIGRHGQAFLVSSVRKREGGWQARWSDINLSHSQSSGMINYFNGLEREANPGQLTISTLTTMSRPKSHGRLILNSSDVDAMPLIDFQYLSHPDDMNVLLEAVKFTVNLYDNTPSFQKQGARYSQVPYKSCSHLPFRSDDYWRCFIRHMAGSGLHAGGTCKMGGGVNDPTAVVDSTLKVVGIEGLRVVDASIMPNVINANTQSAVYVIAEKASDMILNEWSITSGWRR